MTVRSKLHGQGMTRAGKNLILDSKVEQWAEKNATLILGDKVYLNGGVVLSSKIRLEVGDSILTGHKTLIFDRDWHGIDGH